MTASQPRTDRVRFRLAANDIETTVADELDEFDVEGHRLAANDNETIVGDELDDLDVEGHGLASNDNETVVEGTTPTDDSSADGAAEAP